MEDELCVIPPMTASVPAVPSDIGVPETLISPPFVRVWPSITKFEEVGFAVNVEPAKVSAGAFVAEETSKGCVLDPIMAIEPLGSSATGVPETVMVPPGVSICPSIANREDESAVNVDPANVNTGALVADETTKDCVLDPTMATDPLGSSAIGVPETVIMPPGESTCPSIANREEESAVNVEPANVKRGAEGADGTSKDCVLDPRTTMDPPGASTMGVPETVIVPPGVRVCPPISKWEDASAVKVEPAKVKASATGAGGLPALPPAMRLPDGATEKYVPSIVTPGPPTDKVVPAIGTIEGSVTLIVCPAAVTTTGVNARAGLPPL